MQWQRRSLRPGVDRRARGGRALLAQHTQLWRSAASSACFSSVSSFVKCRGGPWRTLVSAPVVGWAGAQQVSPSPRVPREVPGAIALGVPSGVCWSWPEVSARCAGRRPVPYNPILYPDPMLCRAGAGRRPVQGGDGAVRGDDYGAAARARRAQPPLARVPEPRRAGAAPPLRAASLALPAPAVPRVAAARCARLQWTATPACTVL
jgi:hypothetical protein